MFDKFSWFTEPLAVFLSHFFKVTKQLYLYTYEHLDTACRNKDYDEGFLTISYKVKFELAFKEYFIWSSSSKK